MAQMLSFLRRGIARVNCKPIVSRLKHTATLSVRDVKPVTVKNANKHLLEMVDACGNASGDVVVQEDDYLPVIEKLEDSTVRKMRDSYQEVVIPLGKDPSERQKYINFFGGIRFGRILEDLDTCAWWICHIHNQDPANGGKIFKSRLAIVTAMVDRIELYDDDTTFSTTKDVKLCGHVTWVGKSSMEVSMVVKQEHEGMMQEKLAARFVMAARDPQNQKSAVVNRLKPDGDIEESLFRAGEENKKRRAEKASQSLRKMLPNEEERNVIHDLYKRTDYAESGTVWINNPPKNTVWISDTKLKNITLCHPEQKNAYSKIFGGFLMRQAYELAWANATLYCKSRPRIKVVDDITFHKPVEIGSILLQSSKVVYTEEQLIQIYVHASVLDPTTGLMDMTNIFYFTFEASTPVHAVVPHSYAEAMLYLDGKRHLKSANSLTVRKENIN